MLRTFRYMIVSAAAMMVVPALAQASSGQTQLDVTPEMVSLFETTPPVTPDVAADCRFANEVRATVAKRHDLDIRGENNFRLANRSKTYANVWAIVLVRESNRAGVDPASVMGPLQTKSAKRRRNGPDLSNLQTIVGVASTCDTIIGSLEVSPAVSDELGDRE